MTKLFSFPGSFPDRHSFPCRVPLQTSKGENNKWHWHSSSLWKCYIFGLEKCVCSMQVSFRTKIYHPNIDEKGQVLPQCVLTAFNHHQNILSQKQHCKTNQVESHHLFKGLPANCVCWELEACHQDWPGSCRLARLKPTRENFPWLMFILLPPKMKNINNVFSSPGDPGFGCPRQLPWAWAPPQGRPGRLVSSHDMWVCQGVNLLVFTVQFSKRLFIHPWIARMVLLCAK